MKKVVFAIQVFGLIAMFPVYVATELNQGKNELTGNNPPSVITESLPQINAQAELNSKAKSINSFLDMSKTGLIN